MGPLVKPETSVKVHRRHHLWSTLTQTLCQWYKSIRFLNRNGPNKGIGLVQCALVHTDPRHKLTQIVWVKSVGSIPLGLGGELVQLNRTNPWSDPSRRTELGQDPFRLKPAPDMTNFDQTYVKSDRPIFQPNRRGPARGELSRAEPIQAT